MFTFDWLQLIPYAATAGGVLIGAWSGAPILGGGARGGAPVDSRVGRRGAPRRLAFLAGLLVASTLWAISEPIPRSQFEAPWPLLLLGGLLVGARLNPGRAGGHGVCGLVRLPRRSVVAVATFLGTGTATAVVVHQLLY